MATDRVCRQCGQIKRIMGRELCQKCYNIEREKEKSAICVDCKEFKPIKAQGLCRKCYARLQKKRKKKISCSRCHKKPVHAYGLCFKCYVKYRKSDSYKKPEKKRPRIYEIKKGDSFECEVCHTIFKAKRDSDQPVRFCSPFCQHKSWSDRNRKQVRELWRNAYSRNKEVKKAWIRKYQRKHPEVHKKAYKKWSQTENGKRKNCEKKKRYIARKAGAEGTHTYEQFLALIKQFNFICLKCGRKFTAKEFTEDHIVPLSKGGSNWISNIQPLCHPCNSGKRDKTIDYRPNYLEAFGDEP